MKWLFNNESGDKPSVRVLCVKMFTFTNDLNTGTKDGRRGPQLCRKQQLGPAHKSRRKAIPECPGMDCPLLLNVSVTKQETEKSGCEDFTSC